MLTAGAWRAWTRLLPIVTLVAVLLGSTTTASQAQTPIGGRRVALVIGNGAYRHVDRLANAGNDARLIAATLTSLNFTLVGGGPLLDLDRAQLAQTVQDFGRALANAEVGLFYYSGHGLQVQGANWLVPVDANPVRPQDLDFQMVDADLVLRQMEGAGTRLNLVLLDACRNNPFGRRGLRAVQSGLAEMRAPQGTLISYATQPGNVASDGNGANSPYTLALANSMRQPDVDIFRMFNQVGLEVKRSTGGSQQPWVSTSPIDGDFYFAGIGPGAVRPAAPPPAPPPAEPASDRLIAAARERRCSILEARLEGGRVVLRGLALAGSDWDAFVRQANATRGLRLAPPEVDLLQPYACVVVDVLGEAVRAGRAAGGGRMIALPSQPLVAGTGATATLRGAAGRPVAVDVFRPDGMVEHFRARPSEIADGDVTVALVPPVGTAPGSRLLSVLVGLEPLVQRPAVERTDAYLAALQGPILGRSDLLADLQPFEVRPAPVAKVAAPPPSSGPRCLAILEKAQLGETLAEDDRAYLKSRCR